MIQSQSEMSFCQFVIKIIYYHVINRKKHLLVKFEIQDSPQKFDVITAHLLESQRTILPIALDTQRVNSGANRWDCALSDANSTISDTHYKNKLTLSSVQ